jgi:hypothetical protein
MEGGMEKQTEPGETHAVIGVIEIVFRCSSRLVARQAGPHVAVAASLVAVRRVWLSRS